MIKYDSTEGPSINKAINNCINISKKFIRLPYFPMINSLFILKRGHNRTTTIYATKCVPRCEFFEFVQHVAQVVCIEIHPSQYAPPVVGDSLSPFTPHCWVRTCAPFVYVGNTCCYIKLRETFIFRRYYSFDLKLCMWRLRRLYRFKWDQWMMFVYYSSGSSFYKTRCCHFDRKMRKYIFLTHLLETMHYASCTFY